MKTHPTIAGNAYVVFSKTGCTVTDSTGTLNMKVPAGDWMSIPAPSDALILSDDNAIVRNANFKLALAPSGVGGGGGSTGGGEPEGDYVLLAPEGHIVGGRLDNLTNANALQYKRSSLTEWDIPLPSVTSLQEAFQGTKLTIWTVNLPQVLLLDGTFQGIPLIHVTMYAPNATNLNSTFRFNYSLLSIEGDFSNVTRAYETCAGNSKLSIFRAALSKLDYAQDMFSGCILNNESVLTICNSLPTWTKGSHPIKLGIHVDHKYDPEVNAALKRLDANYEPLNLPIDETTGDYVEITESKGWTITVQWNGTATENAYPNPAATYSLRPQVAPVYAKLGEDSDGNPMLDWGHYVTNWEENGYMEFASLEEAKAYFSITE